MLVTADLLQRPYDNTGSGLLLFILASFPCRLKVKTVARCQIFQCSNESVKVKRLPGLCLLEIRHNKLYEFDLSGVSSSMRCSSKASRTAVTWWDHRGWRLSRLLSAECCCMYTG